ncbi:fibulin-1-like isoform X2 [Physella acuta]|uniref:fibulin-1-like isoform X2 n=1 Tax=Physella acuta TaxID=109671 RepID=UPI0027DDB136|nr:fibulin-1-like isoform X2 [Physella acuta]
MKFSKVNIAAILFMCISYAHAKCRCQQITTVVNGQNVCSCNPGYIVNPANPAKCLDIDECKAQSSPCEQVCTNTPGSYTCSCNDGYVISSTDPTQCDDIDECSAQPSPCQQNCTNRDGSFTCSCRPGFAVNTTDPTRCYALCVPLPTPIKETRNASSPLECYSACRAENCFAFKFADGVCTTERYVGDVRNVTQNVVAGSGIVCYNDSTQCTLKSGATPVKVTPTNHEACYTNCLDNPECIGYLYIPGVYCMLYYPSGSIVDINNFPVDKLVYLDCDR